MLHFEKLPILQGNNHSVRPLRICFVTHEYLGYPMCGGIGTAVTNWAEALTDAGHHVDVLLTQDVPVRASAADSKKPSISFLRAMNTYHSSSNLIVKSHRVFSHLASCAYDVVYFHEWLGQGYYSLLAKRQCLAFEKTLLCTVAHGPTPWVNEANQQLPFSATCIEAEYMERKSVELADVLLSPSRFMLSWMDGYGWRLPVRTHILPYYTGLPAPPGDASQTSPPIPREIVFFGRIETRKGVALFCDAVDILAANGSCPETVTFLGLPGTVEGLSASEYLRHRATPWPCRWQHRANMSRSEAIAYISNRPCLAIMPSISDNSPNTVYECLSAGIPFLATKTGGTPEIVAEGDRERILFHHRPAALADRLREALSKGVQPARPALTSDEARSLWLGWHAHLSHERFWTPPDEDANGQKPFPKVSVCLTHHDRPETLMEALGSLKTQDYPEYEVVLVDDGSELPESHAALEALEKDFTSRGWILSRGKNRYLGAARNACARLANGEYLLFMDDDNLAKPHELSTFVRAARATGADVLTCVADFFKAPGPKGDKKPQPLGYYVPLGGAVGAGFLSNSFGDANMLVKASVFKELGGFTEDRDAGFEDWEFLAKAVLAGYDLQVVPLALFSYRANPTGMLKTTRADLNLRRAMRPYLERFPTELAQAMLLCQGAPERLRAARNEIWALRQVLEDDHGGRPSTDSQGMTDTVRELEAPRPSPFWLGKVLRRSPLGMAARRLRRESDARLLRGNRLFDAKWYLAAYPDVAAAAADPVVHYLAHGTSEGRNPNACFDTRFYLETYRDVAASGLNPLVHYIRYGQAEGRAPMPPRESSSLFSSSINVSATKSPRVICPAADWAVSGVHSVVERIGEGLRDNGWDFLILFTASRESVLKSSDGRLPSLPHEFLPISGLEGQHYVRALGDFFSRHAPCVFFCGCDFRANRAAALMPGTAGVIVHSHSDEDVYYEQSALLAGTCKANICVSCAVEDKVRRLRGLEGKTWHIPNGGLHAEEVRSRPEVTTGAPGEVELRCVYTGRLVQRQKRVLDFIPLVRYLELSGRPYQISLIGQDFDGTEAVLRRELRGPISRGQVRLPGRMGRDELLRELDAHDFFLLLSDYEGFSVSLAEAMGRGCVPLVASTYSGNREIVRSGHNGMVMDHRDYRRWAQWLLDTSADRASWLRLSRAASETVRSSFTIEHQMERIDALLRTLWTPEGI